MGALAVYRVLVTKTTTWVVVAEGVAEAQAMATAAASGAITPGARFINRSISVGQVDLVADVTA